MVRIGIIGLGFMGRMHIGAYEKIDGARLVAVADKDEKRAQGDFSGGWSNVAGAAEKLDMTGITGTTDFHELITSPNVDMVDICVPTPFHEELAVAALKAGKHVLCEKPLALDSGAAQRIADTAAKSKGMFMPAMCMRFWPQWVWLKKAIDEKRYGVVTGAVFRRCASMPPGWFSKGDLSGGAILDLHIHDTDFVFHLFGKPDAVFSRGYSKTSGKTDHIVTQYLYDKGPRLVSAEGSWCMADGFAFTMRYTVNFEKASVDFDISRENQLILSHAGKSENITLDGDGYAAELAYFINCINKGEKPTLVTAADAVTGLRILEAEQKSIDTGAPAKV
ncbi:MAG: gfo/Idh/MocA family oxidoreductase [Planctomycetes bacterium]|nr:gfo/Idh/MocA family oxidoreductase [Planctomycetota bacterium]